MIEWPDRPTDKLIGVSAAGVADVQKVVTDFADGYDAPGFLTDGIVFEPKDAGCILRFPRDIPADIFLYLLNYLKYPIDRTGFRDPQAHCTVDDDFARLGAPHVGDKAFAYVSEESDYDTVRLLFSRGEAWEFSFREGGRWALLPQESRGFADFWVGNA